MTYAVKEIFLTLQGEGYHSGRAAVFCRFAGCNLWSGREQDRHAAICRFCDTDFVGADAGRFTDPHALAREIDALWPQSGAKLVVFTGGEPLLQLDAALVLAVRGRGFAIAVETNGTIAPAPMGIDWLCVSPKAGAQWRLRQGDELKLVLPQTGFDLDACLALPFRRFSLQPMDGPELARNVAQVVDHCLRDPRWRLSAQTHKSLGIR